MKRFGFDNEAVPNDLSLALGAGDVAPLSVAAGYAAFANGGYKVTPYFIDRVVTADGEVLYETKPLYCPDCNTPPETPVQLEPAKPELVSDATELYPKQRAAPRVISPQNAYLISDMLWDVVRRGTGARARRELGRNDLAGKTGTTNEGRDTWFVGFNANIVGASWVGFDAFSAARRQRAGQLRGAADVDRLHARGVRGHARATAETAARNRRVPHQSRRRASSPSDGASERHFREVRYRSLAGA